MSAKKQRPRPRAKKEGGGGQPSRLLLAAATFAVLVVVLLRLHFAICPWRGRGEYSYGGQLLLRGGVSLP